MQEDFQAAASARDELAALDLRARQLELGAARAAAASAGVLFRVGAIVRHRRYDYSGVIVGYDPVCLAPDSWCELMRVDLLPNGRNQPFFHVLVDERCRPGGQTTYVAQENIAVERAPREVRHPLISRYFSAFAPEEGGYQPGPLLRQAYPHDF
ncbi:F-box only 21 [Micractinium conductrix]|uniref:F-box only 21 n=1 Tax=Micractinium conductrix TaxID=554055 RepID=A0A2P6VRP2_9CHLO|nr:F-box only 21 [Micractinium conductrix]|eukprot:PSC76764.1 F-box only 21 [Micractinium conductrix]